MAFKMKNPSVAKMAKAAGSNRVAMKMKAESAMKHKTGEIHGHSPSGVIHDKKGNKMITGADGVTRTQRQHEFAKDEIAARVARKKAAKKDKAAEKDSDSPAKLKKPTRKKDGPKAIDKARKKVGDTSRPKGSATKMKKDDSSMKMKKPMKMKKSAMKVHEKGHKENYVDEKQPDGSIKRRYIFGGPDGQAKSDFKPMEKMEKLPKMEKKEFKKYEPLPKKEYKLPKAKRASAAKMKKSAVKHLAMNPGFGTMKELKEHNKDVIAPKGDARKNAKNWTHKKKGKQ